MTIRPALLTALFVLLPAAAQAQWSQAAAYPMPWSQNAMVADDVGNIYSFTGRTRIANMTVNLDCAYRYNVCTNSWTQLDNFAWFTHGSEAVYHSDGFIYLNGGLQGSPGSFYRYDTAANTYTQLATAPTATNSWEPALVEDGAGLIHWIGGEDYGWEHLVYNPTTNTWSAAAAPLFPIFGAEAGYDPTTNTVLVFGGWAANNSELGLPTALVQRYHPNTNSWSLGASIPTATAWAKRSPDQRPLLPLRWFGPIQRWQHTAFR